MGCACVDTGECPFYRPDLRQWLLAHGPMALLVDVGIRPRGETVRRLPTPGAPPTRQENI